MATADLPSILTVSQLRERWLPHRERLDSIKDSHPTSVRFHRACSWLEEAERLDVETQGDHILIFQWTAFNALYGQWNMDRHESLGDRESWQEFLVRMLKLDEAGHIVALLQENRGLVLAILGNAYLNRYFWHDPNSDKAGVAGRGARHRAEAWYVEGAWSIILGQVVERIYLLRCQLVHGAATNRSGIEVRPRKPLVD